ncbi:uncharacterized protein RJT21DRAFT_117785 [Scheffersomyces amazonensis]|uniref:uncharacterized protein n=1 Tax=Scheffersomyces amazonensis TaxID=1078765 RepID=UPI00315C6966
MSTTELQPQNNSGLRSILSKYNFKLSSASDDYLERRKRQMVLFLTSSAITIFASRFAYKATITRQFVPTLFQGNHHPPTSYNFTTDAAVAVGTGTLLCGSVSSMIIFGTAWIMDVSSFKEFGWRMKLVMGGHDNEVKLSQIPLDEESAYIQDGLNDLLEGKYDDLPNDEQQTKSE